MGQLFTGVPVSLAFLAGLLSPALAQTPPNEDVTFRSDVSLVRVDVQVRDRTNHPITGLRQEDFVLRDQGKIQPIRGFATEEVPLDVLLLLDVSGSMRPHVENIAVAARRALDALGRDDRVAIMVFDRVTRVRMPFKDNHDEIVRGLNRVLDQESFNGGTDITRGMLEAADYIGRYARKDARRAIVILTDDVTGRDRNEDAVLSALDRADAIMSALITPDAMSQQFPGGGRGGRGGSWPPQWPNGGGGGGSLPDIIFGRRIPSGTPMPPAGGGRGIPGLGTGMQSAGTSEIARESGGDSMPAADASSLETTLARLRKRYALFFQAPPDVRGGQQRAIEVNLAGNAANRYADAQIRFRRSYRGEAPTPSQSGNTDETVVVQTTPAETTTAPPTTSNPSSPAPTLRRRTVSDDSRGPRGPNLDVGSPKQIAPTTTTTPAPTEAAPATAAAPRKGWRTINDPEPPTETTEPQPPTLKPKKN